MTGPDDPGADQAAEPQPDDRPSDEVVVDPTLPDAPDIGHPE